MFSSDDSDWQSLGGDGSDGSNELVRNRPVSAVTFSSLQPHLLMTAHPYDEADEEDLRPFKVDTQVFGSCFFCMVTALFGSGNILYLEHIFARCTVR